MTDEPKFMTLQDFAGKVEWEGGVLGALDYGLSSTHLDPNDPVAAAIREKWSELEDAYEEVDTMACELGDIFAEILAADATSKPTQ